MTQKANITPVVFKGNDNLRNYWPLRLISGPGKIMERILLETTSKHTKESYVIWNGQYGFFRGKTVLDQPGCLQKTKPTVYMDKVPEYIIYLDFYKTFNAVSHSVSSWELRKKELDRQMGWKLARLSGSTINGLMSGSWPVVSWIP